MDFSMNIIRKIANRIAKTNFARKAIDEGADLSAFKKKLTVPNLFGSSGAIKNPPSVSYSGDSGNCRV